MSLTNYKQKIKYFLRFLIIQTVTHRKSVTKKIAFLKVYTHIIFPLIFLSYIDVIQKNSSRNAEFNNTYTFTFYYCCIPQEVFVEICNFRIISTWKKYNQFHTFQYSQVPFTSIPAAAFKCSPLFLTVLQNTKIRANLFTECVTRTVTEGQTYILTSLIAVSLK